MNEQVYTDFLNNDLFRVLEVVSIENRRTMWFQQDGCPAHSARISRSTLNQLFPERWNDGRGSTVREWPARSPDLTPLDFFLWGRLKDLVYINQPTTKYGMKDRIRRACAEITPLEIMAAVNNVRSRAELCVR